MNRFQ